MKKLLYLLLPLLLLSIISCNEDEGIIADFYMYPNPINGSPQNTANFKILFSQSISGQIEITVYNRIRISLWNKTEDIAGPANEAIIEWSGMNSSGQKLTPGIYYAKASLKGTYSSEKTIEIIVN